MHSEEVLNSFDTHVCNRSSHGKDLRFIGASTKIWMWFIKYMKGKVKKIVSVKNGVRNVKIINILKNKKKQICTKTLCISIQIVITIYIYVCRIQSLWNGNLKHIPPNLWETVSQILGKILALDSTVCFLVGRELNYLTYQNSFV